jgi:hypothetical protein
MHEIKQSKTEKDFLKKRRAETERVMMGRSV